MFDIPRLSRWHDGNSRLYDSEFYHNLEFGLDIPMWVNAKLLAQVRADKITYRFAVMAQRRVRRLRRKVIA